MTSHLAELFHLTIPREILWRLAEILLLYAANILPAYLVKHPIPAPICNLIYTLSLLVFPSIHIDVHDPVLAERVYWLVNVSLFALLIGCHYYGIRVLKRRGMYMEPRSGKPPAGTGVAEWRCPVCGRQNDRWYVSCHHCGADRLNGPAVTEGDCNVDTVREGENDPWIT